MKRVSYYERKPRLDIVKEKLWALIREFPGLTYDEIHMRFASKYGFFAKTDNRLRDLRQEGRAIAIQDTEKGLLVWHGLIKNAGSE